jgi:hypothetical protein
VAHGSPPGAHPASGPDIVTKVYRYTGERVVADQQLSDHEIRMLIHEEHLGRSLIEVIGENGVIRAVASAQDALSHCVSILWASSNAAPNIVVEHWNNLAGHRDLIRNAMRLDLGHKISGTPAP